VVVSLGPVWLVSVSMWVWGVLCRVGIGVLVHCCMSENMYFLWIFLQLWLSFEYVVFRVWI